MFLLMLYNIIKFVFQVCLAHGIRAYFLLYNSLTDIIEKCNQNIIKIKTKGCIKPFVAFVSGVNG